MLSLCSIYTFLLFNFNENEIKRPLYYLDMHFPILPMAAK